MHPAPPITVQFPLIPKRFQRLREKEYRPWADIQLSSELREAAGLGSNFLTIQLQSPRELAVYGELALSNRGEAPALMIQVISPELTLPRRLDAAGLEAVTIIRLREPLDLAARGGTIMVALEPVPVTEPSAA